MSTYDQWKLATPPEYEEMGPDEEMDEEGFVPCKFCYEFGPTEEAHLHQGDYVGECCWDERLRMTE